MNCPVLELTEELIRRESVTPNDAGCLNVLGARLERLGFQLESIDRQGVSNLWATYGNQGPMVCLRDILMSFQRVILMSGRLILSPQRQLRRDISEGAVRPT